MKKEYGSGSNTNNKKNALSSLTINKKKRGSQIQRFAMVFPHKVLIPFEVNFMTTLTTFNGSNP